MVDASSPDPPNSPPAPAAPAPRRRLTLLDGLVLIAALAPGLLMGRTVFEQEGDDPPDWTHGVGSPILQAVMGWPCLVVALATPCLATLTLALVPLRYARPRPSRRRLARSRGWAAIGVGSLAILFGWGGLLALMWPYKEPQVPVVPILVSPLIVTGAIAGSWITLRQTGRSRPAGDWIDRAGVALGWAWFVAAPACFWVIVD